jgi:acetylornithine/N-succinyldiaminopimelate aminotransferase
MSLASSYPSLEKTIEALVEEQMQLNQDITGLKAADPQKQQDYQRKLQFMADMRGQKLWYPYLGSGRGRGPFVELADGSIKYDFIGGIGPHIYGHSHPRLTRVNIEAALQDTVMQGNLQQNVDSLHVMEVLLQLSGMNHGFLTTSGAMACENALKIAFQKKAPANRLLAFEHCFMGRTLALSQVTDKPAYRFGLPHTLNVDYLPYFDEEAPEKSLQEALSALTTFTQRYPGAHACLVCELVQGEGGLRPAHSNFLRVLFEKARSLGILVIADEIQTFLRTSQPFAYQHFETADLIDIVTLGKASQLCATLFRSALNPKPGLLSQTFTASTSAIRSCYTIIEMMRERGHFGNDGVNNKLHSKWIELMEALRKKYPDWVKGSYGIGLMMAFTPFGGDSKKAEAFSRHLFEEGVICFLAGENPKRARFLIPGLVIETQHLEEAATCIERALIKTDKMMND